MCDAYFDGNGFECTDVNECEAETSPCGVGFTCTNVVGGPPLCTCPSGHSITATGACVDLRSCGGLSCHANAGCDANDGAPKCTCDAGYTGDGQICTLTDPCASAACGPNAVCQGLVGAYICECEPGYARTAGPTSPCEDLNECAILGEGCGQNAQCVNTEGAFECVCDAGYTFDGAACVDVNECNAAVCGANTTCTNLPGTYQCACAAGFSLQGNACVDVDECALETALCRTDQLCVNEPGNYSCECEHALGPTGTCITFEASIDAAVGPPQVLTVESAPGESAFFLVQVDTEVIGHFETSGAQCDKRTSDTVIELYKYPENGPLSIVAADDDSGFAWCSMFTHILRPGQYAVRIRHFQPQSGLSGVLLTVQATPL